MTNRYTLTEALAVVVDQIDGEDLNADTLAGLLDPLRQLLEDLIPLAEAAGELMERSADEEQLETSDALDILRGLASFDPATPEPRLEIGKQRTDFMVGQFNATQAARDLIQEAKKTSETTREFSDTENTDPDQEVEYALEDLEQDTMGVASRIGDEAWTYYHATKSEVERLQQFPEEGGEA